MRIAVILVLMLLGGCTSLVQADVTRFHTLPPGPGQSFTIVPDSTQTGSLEFQRYAEMVADALVAQGWVAVPPGGKVDTHVHVHWGMGDARTEVWQSPSAVYTGMGWGPYGHYYGGGFAYDPFPYWETRSATYYSKWLEVEIVEAASPHRQIFSGRALAEGTSREVAPVIPYLVRALFTGFPGNNGSTVRIEVPVNK